MDSLAAACDSWLTGTQLLVPILASLLVALLTSFLTYHFTRKTRLDAEWRVDKLKHYEELIASITHLMSMPDDAPLAFKNFQRIANVIALVAPQEVVNILIKFQEEFHELWKDEPDDKKKIVNAKQSLFDLVLAIRKDLKIRPKDKPKSFSFYLKSPLILDD